MKYFKLIIILIVACSCSNKNNLSLYIKNVDSVAFDTRIEIEFANTSKTDLRIKIKNDSAINTHSGENFIYYKIFDENYNEILKQGVRFTGSDYLYYNYIESPDSIKIYLEKIKRKKVERLKRIQDHQINYTLKPDNKITLCLQLERLEEDFTELEFDDHFFSVNFDESKTHYIAFYYKTDVITLNNKKEKSVETRTLISPYYPLRKEFYKDNQTTIQLSEIL